MHRQNADDFRRAAEGAPVSKPALYTILALVTAFAAYEVLLNYALRQVNDDALAVCLKPANVPPVSQSAVFYIPHKRKAL